MVNITSNGDGTYSADKTFDEIVQVYNEGKYNIVANVAEFKFPVIAHLTAILEHAILFSNSFAPEKNDANLITIGISSNNELAVILTPVVTKASKLPNPYPLTFTGAVTGSYDGSSAKTIDIPIGAAGKSAYQYAVDGGYTGTEAEFAEKLAAEKFANPNALTFTGAVTGSYDGSAPLEVAIPNGGGSGFDEWERINTFTIPADTAEDVTSIIFSEDAEGKPFALKKFYAVFAGITGGGTYFCIRINDLHITQQFRTDTISNNNIDKHNPLILYFEIAGSGLYHWSCPNVKSFGYRADGDGTPNGGTQSNISQVNKIFFAWGTNSAITPGTTVKLWGVRT